MFLYEKLAESGYKLEAEIFKKSYRNAIYLKAKKLTDIPIGASKCGGNPDLPPEIGYPVSDSCSMTLMLQVNFKELAESGADLENIFPKTGMLYIFWNGEILDELDHSVIYWDGDMSSLKRTEPPFPINRETFGENYEGYAVGFESGEEYTDEARMEIDRELEDFIYKNYDGNCDWLAESDDKLLGVPTGGNKPDFGENEILLFQSNFHCGCLWSEYWIASKNDIKNRCFDAWFDFDMD